MVRLRPPCEPGTIRVACEGKPSRGSPTVTLRIIWHKILPAFWHNLQLLMAAPSIVWRRLSKPGLSQNEMIRYQFETKGSLIAQLGHPTEALKILT
jgi:hypothetical protein